MAKKLSQSPTRPRKATVARRQQASKVGKSAIRPLGPPLRVRNPQSTIARPGYFGLYGGRFVPETLMAALEQLEREYNAAMADKKFLARLDQCYREIAGRPSELYLCRRLT